jgi:hypothetical protein
MDYPPEHGWRESIKLVPNYRIQSATNEIDWYVDVYCGHFYVAGVGNRLNEKCRSIPQIVGYLCRMLLVQPRGK